MTIYHLVNLDHGLDNIVASYTTREDAALAQQDYDYKHHFTVIIESALKTAYNGEFKE